MSAEPQSPSIRDRTRRAVRGELVEVALRLFVEQGYNEVRVDQIADAAGMSKRTFFRYFPSKDALLLGKYDKLGEDLAAALAARPADEPAWRALRRMFDGVVDYISDPGRAAQAEAIDHIIQSSDVLRAGYLERMQRAQERIVSVVLERAPGTVGELEAAAAVAAAFSALSTAHLHAARSSMPLAEALDMAMSAISAIS
ncbi:TetR family transcriptional regulator [Microbacterium sp. JZ70]